MNLLFRLYTILFFILLSTSIVNAIPKSNLDSLENILYSENPDEIKAKVVSKLIDLNYDSNIVDAIKYGKIGEDLVNISDTSKMELFWSLGMCYYKILEYDIALDYFFKSLKISEKLKINERSSSNYNNIGAIYFSINEYEKSTIYINKALDLLSSTKNYEGLAYVYSNSVEVYLKLNNSPKAKEFLNKSIEINDKYLNNSEKEVRDLSSLAGIYIFEKKYNKAIETCKEAISKIETYNINNVRVNTNIYESLAISCIRTKQYKNAQKYANEMIINAKANGSLEDIRNGYNLLYKSYEGVNDFKNAFKYQQIYTTYNDSLSRKNKLKEIFQVEAKNEISEMESKINLLKKDKELLQKQELVSKQQKYLWFVGFILIILILIFVYFFFNNKLKKSKIEEEVLNSKLSYTQNELTTLALTIVQKNNALEVLKKNLKNLNKVEDVEERKKSLRSLMLDLGNAMGLEQDKIIVQEKISSLESEYLRRLDEKFPKLTKSEKKLSVFLRANFSSKEIASILNISHHSVNVNRYRLRKKLNLDQGADLVKFLSKL